MNQHKNWPKLILGNLFVLAAMLIVLNFLASTAMYIIDSVKSSVASDSRWELPNYADDREHAKAIFHDYQKMTTRYAPFTGWKRQPYSGSTTTIGTDGHRVVPQPEGAKPDRPIVRFFGGSTMWGTGADDEGTIPALFQKAHPEVRVINHGETAFNSRQELAALVNLIATGEELGTVIFYDGANDAYHPCFSLNEDIPTHARQAYLEDAAAKHKVSSPGKFFRQLFFENTLRLVIEIVGEERPGSCGTMNCHCDEEKADRIAAAMMNNWKSAKTLTEANGGQFMAFLQPTAFTGHPKLDHLPGVDHSPEGIRENFEAVYPRMKAAMINEKADWAYDLSRVFDGSEGYAFIDFCHLSKNGNEVVARHIGDVFEKPKSKIEKVEDGQTKVDENRMPPLHLKSERNTEI